jgi:hypothetical protein
LGFIHGEITISGRGGLVKATDSCQESPNSPGSMLKNGNEVTNPGTSLFIPLEFPFRSQMEYFQEDGNIFSGYKLGNSLSFFSCSCDPTGI